MSTTLRVERVEDRICLSGVDVSDSLLNIATGVIGEAGLIKMFKNGQNAAQAAIKAGAFDNNPLQHVIYDSSLVTIVVGTGILAEEALAVSSAAEAVYAGTATATDAGALVLAVEGLAFGLGAADVIYQDLVSNGMQALAQLQSLGQNVLQQVKNNATALGNAFSSLAGNLQDNVQQAITDFLAPIPAPDQVDQTPTTFDPDNDGDDDTGATGY